MKNKLLIIAMSDLTILNKAPARRMKEIIDGYKEMKIPIDIISGERKKRSKLTRDYLFSNSLNDYRGIYIESSNSGMLFSEFLLLLKAKIKNIPISVYIRDGYPLFKEYWLPKFCNQNIANFLWLLSYFCYRFLVNTMYFPSQMLMEKFNFNNKKLLLPAMLDIKQNLTLAKTNSIFYAGGIGQQYDIETFLMACDKLFSEQYFEVIMYCRENEIYRISKWLNKSWLKIEHKNLEELDFQPTIGIIPLKKHAYSDLAFPVKLLDYVGINCVILASDSTTLKQFIEEKKIGLIVEAENIQSYFEQIRLLLTDTNLYTHLKTNVLKLQKSQEITWKARCQKVLDDFGFER